MFWQADLKGIFVGIRLFETVTRSAGFGADFQVGFSRNRKFIAPGIFPGSGTVRARYYEPKDSIKVGSGWLELYRNGDLAQAPSAR